MRKCKYKKDGISISFDCIYSCDGYGTINMSSTIMSDTDHKCEHYAKQEKQEKLEYLLYPWYKRILRRIKNVCKV